MNLDQWKERSHERLRKITQTLWQMTPGMSYGALSAAVVLPLVAAASAGQAPYGELFALLGGIGGNLLANQLQTWKDKSDEEVTAALANHAKTDPNWTAALDTLLEKFESLRVVQVILSEADKDELKGHVDEAVRTLQAGLREVGSRLTIEVKGDRNVTIGGKEDWTK